MQKSVTVWSERELCNSLQLNLLRPPPPIKICMSVTTALTGQNSTGAIFLAYGNNEIGAAFLS